METETKLNWKSLISLIKHATVPKWMIAAGILLSLLETGGGLIVPLFTKSLVDQLSAASLKPSLLILLASALILQTAAAGFSFYFMTYIGEAIVASIRRRLWNQVLHLPIPYFDRHQTGEIMSRVTQDTNIVKNLVTQHLVSFFTGIISIIGAVAILLFIDWKMTLIMVTAVPLALLLILPLGRKMYKISKASQDEMAGFSANLGRVLSDIRLVKAFNAEKTEQAKGEDGIDHLFGFGLKEARIQAVISPFMTFIMMLVLVILIGYGGVRVASGTLTAGSLVAILIYVFQIIIPFSQMASFFTSLQKAAGATERISTILTSKTETDSNGIAVTGSSADIRFDNLSFSYHENEAVIKNISLTIPAGKTTAFVGPSGSGKTTLFALLERFYGPSAGSILYGSTSIGDFSLNAWRSQIGYVSQESPIMSGTIRDNIAYGIQREVSDDEIQQAARLAHAEEFINRLPAGYLTEVGERGIKLSGGQRQRLAIARALIRNPGILLLDEATSNLDSSSEVLVQNALASLMEGRTTLVIAHRLSTVVDADQIVVLDNGQVTGTGSHQELLNTHSLYKKLASQQLKGERQS
ncbi:ABC transporter ATP-binding protein [Mesobacillus zeae]|uniref:ABC transporter ATP-binding protein n=1 Tax=Mesobacillus zeae TaxID=1917180 RepID=A0A398BH68_9BACI|nr:ABC transporter ATP-binding protein [Mesobacillus zeae]RID86813.1 ABC transporter ATP-binding protein [Mesobacillus zeae]